jgi:predicted transcriptional regulator
MWLKRQLGAPSASLGQLGALESEVMERIWTRGETSVRDLHAVFAPRLAYTTIMTTLDRLHRKGLLKRSKLGKAFIYRPAFSEQEYHEQLAQHLFGMALDGPKDSQAVLSRFVDVVSQTDLEMLEQLDELVKAKRRALRRRESR